MSSGAIAAIAVRVAAELDEGNVVFVAPDDGWKYLSSGVYSKTIEQLEAEGVLESGASGKSGAYGTGLAATGLSSTSSAY